MSSNTSIILYISPLEHAEKRIEEVNTFKLKVNNINLLNLNDSNIFPDAFPRFIYAGTFNYFDLDGFLIHLQTKVNWEFPDYVQLMVQGELDYTLKFYSKAGKELLVDSIKA